MKTLSERLAGRPDVGMTIFATAATMLVSAVLLTNWPTYQFEFRGGPIALWFYFMPGILVVPILFAEPQTAVRYFREPLLWWFVVYVVSGLVWLLFAQDFIEDANRQWRLRVLALFFFYTATLLTSHADRKLCAWVIAGLMLFACAANWVDVLRPYRFVPQASEDLHSGRGAGFFVNPNVAASFIVVATIAALPFIAKRLRVLLLIAAVAGVAPTLSRSGYIYAGVMVMGSMVLGLLRRTQAVALVVVLGLLALATVAFYDSILAASDNVHLHLLVRRLSWFEDLEEDGSVYARKYAAANAWRMFLDAPLTGGGIGATMLQILFEGPHNMYLTLAGEQGLLGLALFLTYIGIVAVRGWRTRQTATTQEAFDAGSAMVVLGAMLATYGLFSHNVLEEAHIMFLVGFITATAFEARQAQYPSPTSAPAAVQPRGSGRTHAELGRS